jgi:hypothetical protein
MEEKDINCDVKMPSPTVDSTQDDPSKAKDPRDISTTNTDLLENENSQPNTPKVSLADVQNAFPAEPSEERIIMQHIELTDPTMGQQNENWTTTPNGNRNSRSSLLDQATALPPELVKTMQEEKVQQMLQDERKASLERARSRKGISHQPGFYKKSAGGSNTVEDELFELTNLLRPRQSGEFDKKNVEGDTDEEDNTTEQEELKPLTQTQAFAANAAEMFQRLTKKVGEHTQSFTSKIGEGGTESDGENSTHSRYSPKTSLHKQVHIAMQNMKEVERIILRGRKSILGYARTTFLLIVLPSTVVAFLLYYVLGNPGANIIYVEDPNANVTHSNSSVPFANTEPISFLSESQSVTNIRIVDNDQPSYSWLILFFGVRQVITFGLAVGFQYLVVAYYQQAGLNFTLVGPMARLLIIQAKVRGLALV